MRSRMREAVRSLRHFSARLCRATADRGQWMVSGKRMNALRSLVPKIVDEGP